MGKRNRAAVLPGVVLSLVLVILPLLTACGIRNMEAETCLEFLEGLAANLGASQITGDGDLMGERVCGGDAYTGSYLAECNGGTGRDVIRRRLHRVPQAPGVWADSGGQGACRGEDSDERSGGGAGDGRGGTL